MAKAFSLAPWNVDPAPLARESDTVTKELFDRYNIVSEDDLRQAMAKPYATSRPFLRTRTSSR